jgi:hypothetical protein
MSIDLPQMAQPIDPTPIARWDLDFSQRFPARLTRRQKESFLGALETELQARGFVTERVDVRHLFMNRNLITRCEKPAVIFMAHYDTPTIMPFWIPPLYRLFGHTRQIMMAIALVVLLQLPTIVSGLLAGVHPTLDAAIDVATAGFYFVLAASFVSMVIPNPHNREDNTSGVIGLLALADWVKDKPAIKEKVQFVFLDNEELGLLGSEGLKRWWNRQGHDYKDAVIISLDCITRGQVPLVIYHFRGQRARQVKPFLEKYLPETRLVNMHIVPLADNYTFRRQAAVDITFGDRTLIPGGYDVPRIHSPQDRDFSPVRLAACVSGLAEFLTGL